MANRNRTRGCLFTLYHPPTKLWYKGVVGFEQATPLNVLWSSWFTKNPIILNLIRVFGKETFLVTVEQIYENPVDATNALREFYKKEFPQFKAEWITDRRITKLYRKGPRPNTPDRRGKNNPHYGHRHKSGAYRIRRAQGFRATYIPRRWSVDEHGNEHFIRGDTPLPQGWRYGRNSRNWSKW